MTAKLRRSNSIEAGELTGTQYTDVYQQGRLAAAAATVLATGGVAADAFAQQAHLLMPYVIATKDECRNHPAIPALVVIPQRLRAVA